MGNVMDRQLTAGSKAALKRLGKGETLEREHNRSKIVWTKDGSFLHHLTFSNLQTIGAVKKTKGRRGYDTFVISANGTRLLKKAR